MNRHVRVAMRRITISLLGLIAFLVLPPPAGAPEVDPKALNILFFGNSIVKSRNVPRLVENLAVVAGRTRPRVFAQTIPGAGLADHLSCPDTDIVITRSLHPGQEWDYVVLQEHSWMPSAVGEPELFRSNVAKLFGRVRAHSPGVVCVLFENWARAEGGWPYPPYYRIAGMNADIRVNTALARDDINADDRRTVARIAPVGSAWEHNGWNGLHMSDRVHATPRGGLLAALVVYRRIYLDDTSDISVDRASAILSCLLLTESDWAELTAAADAVDELPAPLVRIHANGDFTPGGEVRIVVTGPAGAAPVAFWSGRSRLSHPWSSGFGFFFLAPPLRGPIDMGTMPGHNMLVYRTTLPSLWPGPCILYLQAITGTRLTHNAFRLVVE